MDNAERAAAYYVAMLAWVGCTADSHELADQFGDEIAFRADAHQVDLAGLPLMSFMLRRVGDARPPLGRARLAATLVATRGRGAAEAMTAHARSRQRSHGAWASARTCSSRSCTSFSRWDGKGIPNGARGEQLPLAIRLVHIASIVEVYHRNGGVDAAVGVARDRAGEQFDPRLVEAFTGCAGDLLDGLAEDSSWDAVIAAEPGLARTLTDDELETALEAVADFADLKSPWFTGHSRGVARLAAEAAKAAVPDDAVTQLRRAALVHDLGRSGVPNTIWDKPGPLTEPERERVRLHPYYTERMLARPEALAGLGAIAACHHERLDGSGYCEAAATVRGSERGVARSARLAPGTPARQAARRRSGGFHRRGEAVFGRHRPVPGADRRDEEAVPRERRDD